MATKRTIAYGPTSCGGMVFPCSTVAYDDKLQSGTTTLKEVSDSWLVNDPSGLVCPNLHGAANYVVCLQTTVQTGNDIDTLHSAWPTVTTIFSYDGYGNVLTQSVSSVSSTDSFTSSTTNTYNADTSDWILNPPASSTTTNHVSAQGVQDVTRSTNFKEVTPSQVSEVDVEPNYLGDSRGLIIKYAYDNWGNLSNSDYSGSNIAERNSGATYDAVGEFPATVTNALAQSAVATFDKNFGGPSVLTDLNNHQTSWTYDGLGRPQKMTRADLTTVNLSYYLCSQPLYTCPNNGLYEVVTQALSHDGQKEVAPTTVVFYDALDRVVARDTQSFDGTTFSRVATTYDSYGRVSSTTRPYFINQAQIFTTNYQYDALWRVSEEDLPDQQGVPGGTVNIYSYAALQTGVTLDTNGRHETTTTLKNAQGLVQQVADSNGGLTSYVYDGFGDPVQITTPGNKVVQNWFDIRGRKTSSTDPDMGTWTYGYDNLGELVSQISPNEAAAGASTTLGYDVLGRLTGRYEPDMNSSWEYDQAANGVGYLDKETCGPPGGTQSSTDVCAGSNYARTYSYESLSRPQSVSVTFQNGTPYTSSEQYDVNTGQLTSVTAFSGLQTTNTYNLGFLTKIADSSSGSVYWTANTMDAEMHLTEETAGDQGSAVTIDRSVYANTGRIETITAGLNGNPDQGVINLAYTWDNVGNLTQRSDVHQNYAENFCYDQLNRLTKYAVIDGGGSSCTSGTVVKAVSYDGGVIGDGNISGKTDLGVYTYGQHGAGPHAVSSINTSSTPPIGSVGCTLASCKFDGVSNPAMFYDADGNMLCVTTHSGCSISAARSYSWTSFDMAAALTAGTNTVSFGYTPEHERGVMVSGGATLYYLNNPAAGVMNEVVPGTTPTWHTYLGAYGHIIAEFWSGGATATSWFVGDHLDSVSALETTSGSTTLTEDYSYGAWGKRRNTDGSDASSCQGPHPDVPVTTRGYTGQEMLDSLCLINLNARIYDPALGRVLSADPTVPDGLNGQAFNRYSYVLNNPLALTDPSGFWSCSDGAVCHPILPIDGSPCWGCSGAGVWGVADNGMVLSAAAAGFAFSAGVTPSELSGYGLDSLAYFGSFNFSVGGASSGPTSFAKGVEWAELTAATQAGWTGGPQADNAPALYDATFNFQFPQLGGEVTNYAAAYGAGVWGRSWSNINWGSTFSNFVPVNDHFTSIMGCFGACLGYSWTKNGQAYLEVGVGTPQVGISREWTNNANNILAGPAVNLNYSLATSSMSLSSPYPASGGATIGSVDLSGGASVTNGISLGTTQNVAIFIGNVLSLINPNTMATGP